MDSQPEMIGQTLSRILATWLHHGPFAINLLPPPMLFPLAATGLNDCGERCSRRPV
jgi:hypothetical protein